MITNEFIAGQVNSFSIKSQGERYPAVASDGNNYLVAWLEECIVDYTIRWQIMGQLISSVGTFDDSAKIVLAPPQGQTLLTLTYFKNNYWLFYSQDENHHIILAQKINNQGNRRCQFIFPRLMLSEMRNAIYLL